MARSDQIAQELMRLAKVADGLALRYQAHMQLHTAAAMAQNAAEVQSRRDDLHTILDAIMDNGEAVHRLINEQLSLPG